MEERISPVSGVVVRLFFLCLLLFPGSLLGGSWDDLISYVKKQLGCSETQAEDFILYVDGFMQETQDDFTLIASVQYPRSKKDSLIGQTISRHFESPKSWVQVSSLNRRKISSFPVLDYLDRLSRLSEIYNYKKVELYFHRDYFQLGEIQCYGDPKYGEVCEFNVSMWQIFKGYRRDGGIYEDATHKDFSFIFYRNNLGQWQVKIKSIAVKGTEEIKGRWNRSGG